MISALLARFLQAENIERDADLAVLQAQARGDAHGDARPARAAAAEQPACVGAVRANAANPRLRRAGAVKILLAQLRHGLLARRARPAHARRLDGDRQAAGRAVRAGAAHRQLPHRASTSTLLSISAPIPNEADC